MIDILPDHKDACCGCRACEQACPADCIRMVEDAEGFLYPLVRSGACTDCGRCEDVCPVRAAGAEAQAAAGRPPRAIGGYHRDAAIRADSSSGGAFTLFAEHVLARGGVVIGSALDDARHAMHVAVDDAGALGRLRGSKYVQSDTADSYARASELLDAGTPVLFVGAPCQVAGLRAFLGRDFDSLLTCDFVCHGVPSPRLFRDYVDLIEARAHGRVRAFRFRTKDDGWRSSGLQTGTKATLDDGRVVRRRPALADPFMNGFLADLTLRPICHACPFKGLPKTYADLTIADFWGVGEVCPELDDGCGTSLVLLHSEKAEAAFAEVRERLEHREVTLADAVRRNPTLLQSVPAHPLRGRFFRAYLRRGLARTVPAYLNPLPWAIHRVRKAIASARHASSRGN